MKNFSLKLFFLCFFAVITVGCNGSGSDDNESGLEFTEILPVDDSSSAEFIIEAIVSNGTALSNTLGNGDFDNVVFQGDSGSVIVNGISTKSDCSGFSTVCTDYDGSVTYTFKDYQVKAKSPYLSYDTYIDGVLNYSWDRRITSTGRNHDSVDISGDSLIVKMIPIESYTIGYIVEDAQVVINSNVGRLYLPDGTSYPVSL